MTLTAGPIFMVFLLKFFQNMFPREKSTLLTEKAGQTGEIQRQGDEEEDHLSRLREMKICSTSKQSAFFSASNK